MSLLVITPTLGVSQWLEETIAGVEALRTQADVIHVLVAPFETASKLRARWKNVEVIEAASTGVYDAINFGASRHPECAWLTWINDDDLLLPGFSEVVRLARAQPDRADVFYGNVCYIDANGLPLAAMPVARLPRDVAPLLSAGLAPLTQQGALIRVRVWAELGGLDQSYRLAADFDFWVRAAASGARFAFVPEKVAAFRVRKGQLSSDVARARSEVARVASRGDLKVGRFAKFAAVIRFRLMNFGCVFRRMIRTGRWRSEGMFSR